jgi:hypothetical protein
MIEITHRVLRHGTPGKPDYGEQDWFTGRALDEAGRLAYAERGDPWETAAAVVEYLAARKVKEVTDGMDQVHNNPTRLPGSGSHGRDAGGGGLFDHWASDEVVDMGNGPHDKR